MTVTPARIAHLAVLTLATARLTRVVTTDWLGEWVIVRPLKNWANRHELPRADPGDVPSEFWEKLHEKRVSEEQPHHQHGWRSKLVKGLDCPFCVGFWLGGAVLAADALLGTSARSARPAGKLWALGLGALALNYVVGHVSSKID